MKALDRYLKSFSVYSPVRVLRALCIVWLTCLPLIIVLDIAQWVLSGTFVVLRPVEWGIQIFTVVVVAVVIAVTDKFSWMNWMARAIWYKSALEAKTNELEHTTDYATHLEDKIRKSATIHNIRPEK